MKKTLSLLAAVLMFSAVNAQSIFSENFNGVASGQMPTGWTVYADNLANDANYSSFNQSWQVVPMNEAGTEKAMASISWTQVSQDCDRWAITPAINIPSAGYKLTFSVYGDDYRFPEKVSVRVSTTGTDTATFTEVRDIVMDNVSASAGQNTIMVDLDSYAGQTVYIAFVNHGDGYYTLIDDVAVSILPTNEIFCMGAMMDRHVPAGTDAPLTIGVYSLGATPLTSFDYSYTVNNGTPVTGTINGINVAYGEYHIFNVTVNIPTVGESNIDITVSNPNGQADPTPADNSYSLTVNTYDPSVATQRTSVLEHFTTAVCPNCPAGHTAIENALNGIEDRVVWIAHHVGYYTDDMTITESNQMMAFYNANTTYAPAVMLDRDRGNATSSDPGPIFSVGNFSQKITSAINAPAYATIAFSNISYNAATRQLSATVSGNFTDNMDFDSPRLSLYLMQDGIVGTQSGAQGSYTHNHVIRACISDVWGDSDAFTTTNAGDTYSKTFTYTVPATFDPAKCWLGAFVSNYTTDINSRQIANGTKSTYLTDYSTTGIAEIESAINVKTYPNPASEVAYITSSRTIRAITVTNALGQEVYNRQGLAVDLYEMNVSEMPTGLYLVTVTTDEGAMTQRFSIVR